MTGAVSSAESCGACAERFGIGWQAVSGGEQWLQTRKYTTYERDANGSDEAMHRRYNRRWSRFDQADPYDGSYNLTDPQSFNRYSYVQNDPVNFVDPSGLNLSSVSCHIAPVTTGGEGGVGHFLAPGLGGLVAYVCVVETIDSGRSGISSVDGIGGSGQQTEREKQKEYDDCKDQAETTKNTAISEARGRLDTALINAGMGGVGAGALAAMNERRRPENDQDYRVPVGAGTITTAILVANASRAFNQEVQSAENVFNQKMRDCNRSFPIRPEIIRERNQRLINMLDNLLRLRPPF